MIRPFLILACSAVMLAPTGHDELVATCVGNHPCKACKNCSQCRYCHKLGGYYGVCSKPIPE
jgi:hypothetical protein